MRWMILVLLLEFYCTAPSQDSANLLYVSPGEVSFKMNTSSGLKEVDMLIKKGKILIEGELDGQRGFLILDTGAPGIIVNKKSLASSEQAAFSVAREVNVQSVVVGELCWAGYEMKALEAWALDLSHLEQALDLKILGLLGYDIFKELTVVIDFPGEKLLIEQAKPSKLIGLYQPKIEIPFELEGHIPVVEANINGYTVRLGIDTGTKSNIIDSKLTQGVLASHFGSQETERLQGLDQQIDIVTSGKIDELCLGTEKLHELHFLTVKLEQLRRATGLTIDGLLGYAFFESYKCLIDFERGRIYLW
jgi:hypothetical protein